MSTKRLTMNVKQPTRQAQEWVKQGSVARASESASRAQIYSARLTLDITADLRRRIKLAALSGGTTVADLLRELLEREFASYSDREP